MQRIILVILLVFGLQTVYGQHLVSDVKAQKLPTPHPSGIIESAAVTPAIPLSDRGFGATFIGTTVFDQQTFGSLGNRFHTYDDGKVSATWLFGQTAPDFNGRGTAYNHFNGVEWGEWPLSRAEGDTRTGYPSFAVTNDEKEFIFSHKIPSGTWEIGIFSKGVDELSWTESSLPTSTTGGLVWPKVAIGGNDDNTIHLLAITLPTQFGGVVYEGMEQHILYYRSQDAGETWDVQDFIIPGLDSTQYLSTDTEAYAIDASGETVAVSVFTQWGDVAVFKSTDNGDNWTRSLIHDFHFLKYDGSGYTSDDIPLDPDAPSETALLTADNAGTVLIDQDDNLHVWFGLMYVEAQDSNFFYFPGMSGMAYWNEGFGEDSVQVIADLEDIDGNGAIDITDFGLYFTSLTSHPTAGLGDDGDIYLAYSAVNELYFNTLQGQNYRNIFIIRSEDGGASWSDPFNLIYEEALAPTFSEEFECAFPQINRDITDRLQLLFMQDFNPGLALNGDMDPFESNTMFFVEYNSSDFSPLSVGVDQPEQAQGIKVFPNPSRGNFTLAYELEANNLVQITIKDLAGRTLQVHDLGELPAGEQQYQLDLNLGSGIFLVEIFADNNRWTEKIVIQP